MVTAYRHRRSRLGRLRCCAPLLPYCTSNNCPRDEYVTLMFIIFSSGTDSCRLCSSYYHGGVLVCITYVGVIGA